MGPERWPALPVVQGPVGVTLSTAAGACEVRGAMLSTIGPFMTGTEMTNQFKFVDLQIPIQFGLKTARVSRELLL